MIEKFKNGSIAWELKGYALLQEESGELGVLEYVKEFDFLVKRIFFLKNIDSKSNRGSHAHKELKQIIICLSGSFEITLDNGLQKKVFKMNEKNKYLYVDGKVWRDMKNFSKNAVMLVLCDREYRYDEVVRNYDDFLMNLKEVNQCIKKN